MGQTLVCAMWSSFTQQTSKLVCCSRYPLISPWSANNGPRFTVVCHEVLAYSTHFCSNTGAKQSSSVNRFIRTTFRSGQGHAGDQAGNYTRPVFVARQLCHNTPVTFRPCQVWCYCPRLTLVCVCARVCVI